MGFVPPPPHDPSVSYAENLRRLHAWGFWNGRLPLIILAAGVPGAAVIGLALAWWLG